MQAYERLNEPEENLSLVIDNRHDSTTSHTKKELISSKLHAKIICFFCGGKIAFGGQPVLLHIGKRLP